MPAARPTQPALANVFAVYSAAGVPASALVVRVAADGSFDVQVLQVTENNSQAGDKAKSTKAKAIKPKINDEDEEPERW
jgi:hypothetical protein